MSPPLLDVLLGTNHQGFVHALVHTHYQQSYILSSSCPGLEHCLICRDGDGPHSDRYLFLVQHLLLQLLDELALLVDLIILSEKEWI